MSRGLAAGENEAETQPERKFIGETMSEGSIKHSRPVASVTHESCAGNANLFFATDSSLGISHSETASSSIDRNYYLTNRTSVPDSFKA